MKILTKQQQNLFVIFSSVLIYIIIGNVSTFVQNFNLVYLTLFFSFTFNILTYTLPLILIYLLSIYYSPDETINFMPLYLYTIFTIILIQSDAMEIIFAIIPNFGYHQLESTFFFSSITLVLIVKLYIYISLRYKISINQRLIRDIALIILILFFSVLTYIITIYIIHIYHNIVDQYIISLLNTNLKIANFKTVFRHLFVWFNSIYIQQDNMLLLLKTNICIKQTCDLLILDNYQLSIAQNIILIPITMLFIYRKYLLNNTKFNPYLLIFIVISSIILQIDFLFYLLINYISFSLFISFILIEIFNTLFIAQLPIGLFIIIICIEIFIVYVLIKKLKPQISISDEPKNHQTMYNRSIIKQIDYSKVKSIDLRDKLIIINLSSPLDIDLKLFTNITSENGNQLLLSYCNTKIEEENIYGDYKSLCYYHYQYLINHMTTDTQCALHNNSL